MRNATPILLLLCALAGCGEWVKDEQFADNSQSERVEPAPVRPPAVPVRVGEPGPNFAACSGAGTTRNLDPQAGERLQVRSAPFETVEESGSVAAGARFFVCTRSHDQRWLGIVYDESGALSPACGVSGPIPARRNYEGPCRSGWVSSALVKLIAG